MKALKFDHYFLAVIILLISITIFFSFKSPIAKAIHSGQLINGLIIGTDLVDYAKHSDTLLFINYNTNNRFLNIISIPRDTHFTPKGYRFRKINEIFAYHYKKNKNAKLAAREVCFAVEELLKNKISIPYYIQINYNGFINFINLIGGITLNIENPMHYDDNAGKLHIHFNPGIQHLDGQKALEYVRYRNKSGDIGRIKRQQIFLKAVLARFKNPLTLIKLPSIITNISNNLKTNLSFWDIIYCLIEIKNINSKDILITQIPGAPRKNYWQINTDDTLGLFNTIIPPEGADICKGPQLRIEIWNASGKKNLEKKVKTILLKKGYNVIASGTSLIKQKKTLINDFTGNLRPSQKISSILSCGEINIHYTSKRYVDISVLLGQDCSIK